MCVYLHIYVCLHVHCLHCCDTVGRMVSKTAVGWRFLHGDPGWPWPNVWWPKKTVLLNKSQEKYIILNWHLTLLRRMDDPLCPLCKEEENTSLHLLDSYWSVAKKRCEFIGRHPKWPKTKTLEHSSQVCKNLQNFSVTLGDAHWAHWRPQR